MLKEVKTIEMEVLAITFGFLALRNILNNITLNT